MPTSERFSRRQVLVGAAAVTGVAAAGVTLHAAERSHAAERTNRVSLLVTDARFEESKRFAAAFAGTARLQLDIAEDVCHHWYGSLRDRVTAEKGDLVGVTTWIDFEVMRGCAAEASYRCRSQNMLPAVGGRPSLVSWIFTPRV